MGILLCQRLKSTQMNNTKLSINLRTVEWIRTIRTISKSSLATVCNVNINVIWKLIMLLIGK